MIALKMLVMMLAIHAVLLFVHWKNESEKCAYQISTAILGAAWIIASSFG